MSIRGILKTQRIYSEIEGELKRVSTRGDAAKQAKRYTPGRSGGRSSELVSARNRHLLCRFLYWNQKPEVKYEWIIGQLSREFYISQCTVGLIITGNLEILRQLRRNKNMRAWKKDYDFFKW